MVIPANRLVGLASMASPVLGSGVGSALNGIGSALKSGGAAGLQAPTGKFAELAQGVLRPLGERGLMGLTKLPRQQGRLGMRRKAPAGMLQAPPGAKATAGIFRPAPGGTETRVESWTKKAETLGKMSGEMSLGLQESMQKSARMLNTLSNILKMTQDAAQGAIGNLR